MFRPHTRNIFGVIQDPVDSRIVLTTATDETVKRFDLCTGKTAWTFRRPGPDTTQPLFAVSPGGRFVATGDPLNRAFIIDAETGSARTFTLPREDRGWYQEPSDAAFSIDDRNVFFQHGYSVLKYDVASGDLLATYKRSSLGGQDGLGVGLRADGRIWSLSQQRGLVSWHPKSPTPTLSRYVSPQPKPTVPARLFGDRFVAAVVTFHQLDRVILLDADTGDIAFTIAGPTWAISGFSMTADLQIAAIASYDQRLRFIDMSNQREIAVFSVLDGAGDPVNASSVSLDPKGRFALVGLWSGELAVYGEPGVLQNVICR